MLYANTEVRQVNRYVYADRATTLATLQTDQAFNYILSPSNIYTKVTIPTADIFSRIKNNVQSKLGESAHVYINLAKLRLDVEWNEDSVDVAHDWAQPAKYMLLLKKSAYDEGFFSQGNTPNDTSAIYSSLSASYSDSLKRYVYYYEFDLAEMFTALLRNDNASDSIDMMLLPVEVTFASSTSYGSYVSAIREEKTITATKIRSSNRIEDPMDVEIVYSGFSDVIIQ